MPTVGHPSTFLTPFLALHSPCNSETHLASHSSTRMTNSPKLLNLKVPVIAPTAVRRRPPRGIYFIRKAIMSLNSFNSRSTLKVGNKEYEIYRLDALDQQGISTRHLPYSLRILLENLLRTEDGRNVKKKDTDSTAPWNKDSKPDKEIAFTPTPPPLPDFTTS